MDLRRFVCFLILRYDLHFRLSVYNGAIRDKTMPLCFTEDETSRRSSLNPPSRNALNASWPEGAFSFSAPPAASVRPRSPRLCCAGRMFCACPPATGGFALPPVDGRWRVLLLDDLQNMQDENDWNALCELIHSGADRRFVLLSPWRAAGLSDCLPVQRNGKILPCAAQSNTIKPPVR